MKNFILFALIMTGTAAASETCIVDGLAVANNDKDKIACTNKLDEQRVSLLSEMDLETNLQFHLKIIQAMKSIGYSFKSANGQTLYFAKPE